jgi:hypothetical protein
MSTLFYGSINITDLMEQAKQKHTAFVKAENGKIYANISVWLNEEPDKYDNVMSLKLSATKEGIEKDPAQGKVYIGNCKLSDRQEPKPLSDKDTAAISSLTDGLPF